MSNRSGPGADAARYAVACAGKRRFTNDGQSKESLQHRSRQQDSTPEFIFMQPIASLCRQKRQPLAFLAPPLYPGRARSHRADLAAAAFGDPRTRCQSAQFSVSQTT